MEAQRPHFRRRRSKRPAFSGCKPPGRESLTTPGRLPGRTRTYPVYATHTQNHSRVLGRSLPYAQDHFPPVFIDAQRGYHLLPLKRCRVDQQRTQPCLVQPALHHLFQFRPTRFDEMFADCGGEKACRRIGCNSTLPGPQTAQRARPSDG